MRLSRLNFVLFVGLGGAVTLLSATALSQPNASGPVRYAMDAATTSGMGAFAGGSGLGGIMNMMRGGPPKATYFLSLHHGANASAPQIFADHFMPKQAGLGASVRLLPPSQGEAGGFPESFERPSGRLLLFWGCGERAASGQPVVIDFAKLADGEVPSGLFLPPIDLPEDWQASTADSRTYTSWPHSQDRKSVPSDSSLVGAHRISATYAKDINFSLAEDFMQPLAASTRNAAGGGYNLGWNGLDKATGYYAWAIGAKEMRRGALVEMVWWASSTQQAFGGPLSDWISPAGVRRLITSGTVMSPDQRECTIPAEVVKAAGEGMMVNLQAYGPQVEFAHPARPANANKAWSPEWIARVRFRSSTMLIPGMKGMDGMESMTGTAQAQDGQLPAKPRKPKCRGLKGLAERAAGLCE